MNDKHLPKTKILDMDDLNHPQFSLVNDTFDMCFGKHWPEVPLRRWEYVAAIVFSEVIEKPGKCLDAGCGNNVFSKFLKKIGCQVYATDIGLANRDEAGIHYRNMSMTDIKYNANTFDYVFAISSIEHVNAGRFKIEGMDFDTGDTQAMRELVRVLKPGGTLILTTDYADKYYPPPGLWPSGSHRIYDEESLIDRLIVPVRESIETVDWFKCLDLMINSSKLKEVEPKGYAYTEMIMTLQKC